MKATDVKQILENILCEVVSAPATYVYEPQKTFHAHVNCLYIQLLKC